MIRSFRDQGTADIFDGIDSIQARRSYPPSLHKLARQKLDQLNWAGVLRDLAAPRGNRLKALTGDRLGQYSIRINRRYRICFEWTDRGPVAVEITDYH